MEAFNLKLVGIHALVGLLILGGALSVKEVPRIGGAAIGFGIALSIILVIQYCWERATNIDLRRIALNYNR